MGHTCEECGTTFETLSSLRLHDCPAAEPAGDGQAEHDHELDDDIAANLERIRELEQAAKRQAEQRSSTELTDALAQAQAGEPAATHQLLAYYERHLADEWNREDDDCYGGFHQRYYEPATAAIDAVVQAAGWPFLADLLEAYWPEVAIDLQQYVAVPEAGGEAAYWEDYPHVSHVLTNVTGRYVIRTRLTEGVAAIPSTALDYLCQFHPNPDDEGAWIDSMPYGWGIDHPEHPFAETIVALLHGDHEIWVGGAFEHAVHADQHAATALLERVLQDDLVDEPALLFSPLSRIEQGAYPYEPQYWDWETVYPTLATDDFEWDPAVKTRLRSLVETTDVAEDLPAEWTFADLER